MNEGSALHQGHRCPSCGALVAADADWCGQCFTPLGDGAPAGTPAIVAPGGGQVEVAEGRASWDCPTCGERNPIEASHCSTCQTPFARLFEDRGRRPQIEPGAALRWSLLFPGIGHWKAGLVADAIARIVLFVWTLGTVLIVLVSRPAGGFGRTFPLFALYVVAASAVYGLSAVDARRAAAGEDPLVSSRTLLWASAALVLVSIVMATLVTLPAARR